MAACSKIAIRNIYDAALTFSDIKSDYKVTDENGYGCESIDRSVIEHILETGIEINHRQLHDNYSIKACSIDGNLTLQSK